MATQMPFCSGVYTYSKTLNRLVLLTNTSNPLCYVPGLSEGCQACPSPCSCPCSCPMPCTCSCSCPPPCPSPCYAQNQSCPMFIQPILYQSPQSPQEMSNSSQGIEMRPQTLENVAPALPSSDVLTALLCNAMARNNDQGCQNNAADRQQNSEQSTVIPMCIPVNPTAPISYARCNESGKRRKGKKYQ